MKVEVRNKVLHLIPESWNELVTAEWIYGELCLAKGGMMQMVIAKPAYKEGDEESVWDELSK